MELYLQNESMAISFTNEFKNDMKTFGLEKKIRGRLLCDKWANKDLFEPLGNSGFLKIRINRLRLLAKDISSLIDEEYRNDRTVILFFRIYKKDNPDYSSLFKKTVSTADKSKAKGRLEQLITKELLQELVNEFKNMKEDIFKKPSLPTDYMEWLQQPPEWSSSKGELEITIYESRKWLEQINSKFRSEFPLFFEIIGNIVFQYDDKIEHEEIEGGVYFASFKQFSILYTSLSDEKRNRSILFLIAPLGTSNREEIEDIYYKQISQDSSLKVLTKIEKNSATVDEIMRNSFRAYPGDILIDYSLWKEIEKEEEANLALSWEEEKILSKIMNTETDRDLPVFINGRAGSGKSTMLQYLFALYMDKIVQNNSKGEILYLTYSSHLLQQAKKTQESIITSHYSSVKKYKDTELEEREKKKINHVIENSFKTFFRLLIEILPENKKKKYILGKKITFKEFEDDFFYKRITKETVRSKISAETAWHTIRSYIKGVKYNSFLKPNGYKNMFKKDKTVSDEIYDIVYTEVWSVYDEFLKEENKWDEQDLVREVLEMVNQRGYEREKDYLAIFCDEAQDFTQIELKFILQISAFNKYNLNEVENYIKVG